MMTGSAQDVRAFARSLRSRPGWTLSIVAVLALGIGANTAMFTVFDAWVLRPLPLHDPDGLLALNQAQPALDRFEVGVSPGDLRDLRQRQTVFSALAAFQRTELNVDDELAPYRVPGLAMEASLFPLLGVQPILGRQLESADDVAGRPAAVALISHRLWRERYGASADVLGRTVRLQGRPHEIVGVMPEGFRFPEWAEVWTPLGIDPDASTRDQRRLSVAARLRDGVTADAALAQVRAIGADLERSYPETNSGWTFHVEPLRRTWVPPVVELAISACLGAGILVLVVICANVAGLLLAQASLRSRETALRMALGANRGRMARQMVVENLCLALPAGALGGVVGILAMRWMLSLAPSAPPYMFAMQMDWKGWAYTFAVALLTAAVCTVAPLGRALDAHVAQRLRESARVSGTRRAARLRGALVIAELALSTALVIAALLMVKSFVVQQSGDQGYRANGVLTAALPLDSPELEDISERVALVDRLRRALVSSGVADTVGASSGLPAGGGQQVRLEAEGKPAERGEGVRAVEHSVTAGYLEALEVPLLSGRLLTSAESLEGGGVVLLSENLARRLFGDADCVGRRVRDLTGGAGPWLRVVGVVADVHGGQDMVRDDRPDVQLYVPYPDSPVRALTLALRGAGDPSATAASVRREIRSAGVAVATGEVLTLREATVRQQWVSRFFGQLLTAYAAIALAIAAVGLYGLVADSVARRRREVAVRMAVGASPREILGMEMTRTARLTAAGIGTGVLLSLVLTRFGAAMLVDVDPRDPLVFGGVVLLIGATAAIATYFPAHRASATDPVRLLRSE